MGAEAVRSRGWNQGREMGNLGAEGKGVLVGAPRWRPGPGTCISLDWSCGNFLNTHILRYSHDSFLTKIHAVKLLGLCLTLHCFVQSDTSVT